MGPITTHVLDTARGRPASGVRVTLDLKQGDEWRQLASSHTDADGRVKALLPAGVPLAAGIYRLTFETAAYFAEQDVTTLYPYVVILVQIEAGDAHYHIPLLVSPFGYTTYRGT